MKCPRCLRLNEESTQLCSCGFPFGNIKDEALEAWFFEIRSILETAYTAANTPWEQSGKSGTFEEWTHLRIPISECVKRPGTFLDIGCANGFLLECLLDWTTKKNIRIVPYGLDYSSKFIEMARERLPAYKEQLFPGNAWDWQPPQRFDYVRTELEYVPLNLREAFVKRLLSEFLTDDGVLLVTHYRSRSEDLSKDWRDEELRSLGFNVIETVSGYRNNGLEGCRVAVVKPDA